MEYDEDDNLPLRKDPDEVAELERQALEAWQEKGLANFGRGGHDCMDVYMTEAVQFPLLTKEKELRLGRRVRKGDLQARNTLVRHNLRLVVWVAKFYSGRGMSLPDLVQEGNLGLMKAADRFDPNRGCRFSTYATRWIRQYIRRALEDKARTIRIPVHRLESLRKVAKVRNKFRTEGKKDPSEDDLASALQVKTDQIKNILAAEKVARVTLLDAPLAGNSQDTFLTASSFHALADRSEMSPETRLEALEARKALLARLQEIKKRVERLCDLRHAAVLFDYYGLGGEDPLTLEAVARRYGVTRERIRQMNVASLARLHLQPEDMGNLRERILWIENLFGEAFVTPVKFNPVEWASSKKSPGRPSTRERNTRTPVDS